MASRGGEDSEEEASRTSAQSERSARTEQAEQAWSSDEASATGPPGASAELRREAGQRLGRVAAATLALEKELALGEGWVMQALAASVARHWAARALPRHPLASDDGLGAAKLRTKLGQLLESLTKQVLALDEVQSHGDAVVKKSRRGISTRLIKDLQAAERLLSRSARLIELDASLRARSGARPAPNAMEVEAAVPLAQAAAGPAPPAAPTAQPQEAPTLQPVHAKAEPETQGRRAQQARPQRRGKPQEQHQRRRRQLRYSVDEDEACVVITVAAPGGATLTLADTRVEVDRASGQLEVFVRGFEPAAFDVTSRALLPLQTTFRQIGPNVLAVKVPKLQAAARRWGADEAAAAAARLQLEREQQAREQQLQEQQLQRREQARREAFYLRELELQYEQAMREAYLREQQRELYLRQLEEEQRCGGGRCGQVYYASDPRAARSFWPLF
jgi:hypothetical protein